MLECFYPDEYLDSAYVVDYAGFYKRGYRGIIFDIDNTLVPHGAPADDRARVLFGDLKSLGFECCLLSNNQRERVEMFNVDIGAHFIEDAHKPSRKGYERAMERMGTTKENTLFVGDQLFTDVYGARRTGLYSVLVKPIHPKEEIQIVLKRYLERIVLYFYQRQLRKKN
ncbi:MAG: YqeG family HAD IIIA-type phosphatase [Clostridiales bacterium]|nr:YqeG family HAD IIIA-type phosphatase [Clostridiales bacterium]